MISNATDPNKDTDLIIECSVSETISVYFSVGEEDSVWNWFVNYVKCDGDSRVGQYTVSVYCVMRVVTRVQDHGSIARHVYTPRYRLQEAELDNPVLGKAGR